MKKIVFILVGLLFFCVGLVFAGDECPLRYQPECSNFPDLPLEKVGERPVGVGGDSEPNEHTKRRWETINETFYDDKVCVWQYRVVEKFWWKAWVFHYEERHDFNVKRHFCVDLDYFDPLSLGDWQRYGTF